MSTKHVRTTGDVVRFGGSLKVTCGDYGAARTLNAVEVVRTWAYAH